MTNAQPVPSLRDEQTLQCPYPVYDRIRDEAPVFRHPELPGIGLITRYKDVVDVLGDPDTFSNNAYRELRSGGVAGYSKVAEVLAQGFEPVTALGQADGALHDYHASMIQPFISPRRLRAMEPRIQAIIDELVSALPFGEPFDAVALLAKPLSVRVMCEFVGVSAADQDIFVKGSDAEALLLGSLGEEEELLNAAQEYVNLQKYAGAQILDRRENPQDDLISSLANTPPPDGLEPSALAQLVHALKAVFTAGNETTRAAISASILRFTNEPEIADQLRKDPSQIPNFIEEILRTDTPLMMLFRRATRDTEVSGCPLAKGNVVATVFAAANRDESRFEHPLTFNMTRPNPRRHLAFGYGVHFCIGAPLARLELKLVLESVLAKFASIHLDAEQSPLYGRSFFIHNLQSLFVTGSASAD